MARKKKKGITDPFLLAEWDYEKNEKGPEEYAPMSNQDAFWVCSKCDYHFKAKINRFIYDFLKINYTNLNFIGLCYVLLKKHAF